VSRPGIYLAARVADRRAGSPTRHFDQEFRRLSGMDQPVFIAAHHAVASNPGATTLEEAVLWDYRFTCGYGGGLPYTVTFNESEKVEYPPLDGDPEAPELQTVVIRGLNVVDAQSARVTIGGVSFEEPCVPSLDHAFTMDIGGRKATLGEHLTSLLQTLLTNSPFASQPMRMECHYAYTIGGLSVRAPVLLLARQDVPIGFDEGFVEQMTSAVHQWLDAVQPPTTDARFIFDLTLWTAMPRIDATLLHLANVSLPMTDVIRP
jgi:hypothetical protein